MYPRFRITEESPIALGSQALGALFLIFQCFSGSCRPAAGRGTPANRGSQRISITAALILPAQTSAQFRPSVCPPLPSSIATLDLPRHETESGASICKECSAVDLGKRLEEADGHFETVRRNGHLEVSTISIPWRRLLFCRQRVLPDVLFQYTIFLLDVSSLFVLYRVAG